jgi:zinc transport system ATP-binding protein
VTPAAATTDNLVTIRGLHVALGGNPILRGVDADLARNKVSALIGLNGAGKSTLLRALVKEVPCTAGQIAFHCGHDHRGPAPEHVGYVPQRLRIEANLPLTVRDLFTMSLQRKPLFLGTRRRVQENMLRLLDQVGARPLVNAQVEKLSGGELQRVLLALALQPSPELLLLDEPAAGIDFKEEEKFYDLIADLNRKTGVTVLLVSHDLSVVTKLAHEVLCLEGGRIACHGPPDAILSHETLSRTFGPGMGVYRHGH